MKARLLTMLLLVTFFTGCRTPQAVFDNMQIVRDNFEIQREIQNLLLDAIDVNPDSYENPEDAYVIAEAIAQQKIDAQVQYREIADAVNRLINYLHADTEVDYILSIISFLKNDETIKKVLEELTQGEER